MSNLKQHIPIFVGSTYIDLIEHRAKVRDTLTRMDTFVHGMEQFGARSGSPVEECLEEVRRCKIYVGIFAMRYGTIPHGYDKSLAHLEYEEALRIGLPIYIFLIDDQKAQVIPSAIDFKNQDKLIQLKQSLLEKHTVDYFVAPDDLANKVGTAIYRALKDNIAGSVQIDEGIEEVLPSHNELLAKSILRRFEFFPERWAGVEFKGCFNNYISQYNLISPKPYVMRTKNIFHSNETIRVQWPLMDSKRQNETFDLYAEKNEAYSMIETDYPAVFEVLAETFIEKAGNSEDESPICGIKVKKILSIVEVIFDADLPF